MRILLIFSFLVAISACGPQSREQVPTTFKLTQAAMTGDQQFTGGTFVRAIEANQNIVRDLWLTSSEAVEFVNGVWVFHAIGFQENFLGPRCGSSDATLVGEALTVEIQLSSSSCEVLLFEDILAEIVTVLCPENYIPVPGDATFSTSNFCVMKWEAKAYKNAGADQGFNADALEGCSAGCTTGNWAPLYHPDTTTTGYRPVSSATAKPWRRIDQQQARTACSNLGSGYALISNAEWMTIAHNIYETDSNWSNGNVGDGFLNRGHSDNDPAVTPCDGQVENVQTNCSTLDPNAATTSWNQKRTHTLSNGEVIWDIAGNVWNWVDWNVTPSEKAYRAADGSPHSGWREWDTIDTNINNGDEMETSTWQSPNVGANSTMGIGQYFAGSNASGGAGLRGGNFNNGLFAGAFALYLNSALTSGGGFGFRCIFRP